MSSEWVQLPGMEALLVRIFRRAEEERFVYPVRLEFWDAAGRFVEGTLFKSDANRVSMSAEIEAKTYKLAGVRLLVGEPAEPIIYRLIDGKNRTISGDLVIFSKQ